MAKPRIIIADLDIQYIFPLQQKFAEEFFDKCDIEIITDVNFFKELFSTPQKLDVLVLSEEFYSAELDRHDISSVFLLTEQYDENDENDVDDEKLTARMEAQSKLNISAHVNKLLKYTSIKEIFSEIIGKSGKSLSVQQKKNEPQIILIYSAAGGTGKTTVALGISACLTKNYKRVLYINADRLQTFQRLLNNQSAISSSDVYSKLANPSKRIYSDIKHVIRKELFFYLPPFKASLMSLNLPYSIYQAVAVSAKQSSDFDFVIVDADSVFDEDKAALLEIADKVIIVTEQNCAAVYATNLLSKSINGVDNEKYFFICNNFDKDKPNALLSSDNTMKFTINEFIDHIDDYDKMTCVDLSNEIGIQKTSLLIV